MKSRLLIKMLAAYFCITVILTIVVFIWSSQAIRSSYEKKTESILADLCMTTGEMVAPYIGTDSVRLGEIIREEGRGSEVRIVVFDTLGIALVDSADDPATLKDLPTSREFINALGGVADTYKGSYGSPAKAAIHATAPVKRADKIVGVVMVALVVDDGIASIPPFVLVSISLFILFCAGLGAVFFSANLLNPIARLDNASRRVSEGDFSVRVFLDRNDELKDLADRFNYMAERIGLLFDQVVRQKDELLQTISSIDEAILVIDSAGRIVLFNEGLKKITQDAPSSGRYYWEVIRDVKVAELIEDVRQKNRSRQEEMEMDDRVYACGASHIDSSDEIIMVFYDITDIRRLERDKKEFVTNVSHELRTPLSAMKGFIETLDVVDDDKKPHYLEIIKRNTDRMIDIVKDLSLLSEFGEKHIPIENGTVNVNDTVRGIVTLFERSASEKGLSITVDTKDDSLVIGADPFLIEQLFINLIDNAVKYTQKGGVTVSLRIFDGVFTAQIEDTGIGIPKEDIPRIFDRFYRVDKSRSRRLGGTGLGLSIVKEIVLLHGGDIEVESSVAFGSKFTVRLPQGRGD